MRPTATVSLLMFDRTSQRLEPFRMSHGRTGGTFDSWRFPASLPRQNHFGIEPIGASEPNLGGRGTCRANRTRLLMGSGVLGPRLGLSTISRIGCHGSYSPRGQSTVTEARGEYDPWHPAGYPFCDHPGIHLEPRTNQARQEPRPPGMPFGKPYQEAEVVSGWNESFRLV